MQYEALYERMVEGIKTNALRRHDMRQRFRSVLDLPIQSCNPAQTRTGFDCQMPNDAATILSVISAHVLRPLLSNG